MPVRDLLNAASGVSNYGPDDPYFYYNTLLLNGDGTNGAQNNTFLDSSTNNFTITRNGNTTQGSFSPYGNLWSVLCTRTASNTSDTKIEVSATAGLGLASNDFCIEMWVYFTNSYTGDGPFCTNVTGAGYTTNTWWFGPHSANSGRVTVYDYNYSTSAPLMAESTSPPINQWTHYALVRNGNSFTIYRNGTSTATATFSGAFAGSSSGLFISKSGDAVTGDHSFDGYLSNLRVVNGSSVYTSTFTPPTSPLTAITNTGLLTLQSNRLIDNSTSAASITVILGTPSVQRFSPFNPTAPYSTSVIGGSGYFDGSGDYLSVADNAALQLGSANFTIETWVYLNNVTTNQTICAKETTGNLAFDLVFNGSNQKLYFDLSSNGSSYTNVISNTEFKANQWYYIVAQRSGTTISFYVNGVLDVTSTFSGSIFNDASAFTLGFRFTAAPFSLNGYITNFRLTNGTALYSSTFSLPTAPLAPVTNTSLLTNMTNAGIPDLAMQNNLETVGNAQVSTSVKKYGTGSLYFDGSSNLLSPATGALGFGTGDFTIEHWLYFPSSPATGQLLRSGGSGNTGGIAWQYNSGNLELYSQNTALEIQAPFSPSATTWYHIALTRSGTTLKVFVNGTQAGSSATSSRNFVDGAIYVAFGGAGYLNGYLDDLRITKGYARYTSNFTPPTAALPTY